MLKEMGNAPSQTACDSKKPRFRPEKRGLQDEGIMKDAAPAYVPRVSIVKFAMRFQEFKKLNRQREPRQTEETRGTPEWSIASRASYLRRQYRLYTNPETKPECVSSLREKDVAYLAKIGFSFVSQYPQGSTPPDMELKLRKSYSIFRKKHASGEEPSISSSVSKEAKLAEWRLGKLDSALGGTLSQREAKELLKIGFDAHAPFANLAKFIEAYYAFTKSFRRAPFRVAPAMDERALADKAYKILRAYEKSLRHQEARLPITQGEIDVLIAIGCLPKE